MDFKKLLTEIREKLNEEELAKVDSLLKTIDREAESLSSELIDVKKEAKEKKLKIREIESQIGDKDTEIAEWKAKAENPDGKKEYETLKTENAKYKERFEKIAAENRKKLESAIEGLAKHPKWEKAKNQFKLPEEKDGKLLFKKLSDEDVEYNANKLQELNDLEYFAEESQKPGGHNTMRNSNGEVDLTALNSPGSIFDVVANNLKR